MLFKRLSPASRDKQIKLSRGFSRKYTNARVLSFSEHKCLEITNFRVND